MRPRAALVWSCPLALLLVFACAWAARAGAQTVGTITGELRAGAGAELALEGVPVQLVQLGREAQPVGETRAVDGRFRFEVPAVSASATYVVSATVEGVTYLATPVLLSPELPEATVEVVVWPATSVRPALSSELSGITVVFVDTRTGEVTLQREDLVLNPTPASWRGDPEGVTLRLPLPAGAREVEGEAWYDGLPTVAAFAPAADVAARVVLRPGVTLVTTRYRVAADLAAPELALELRAALPTAQLRILVPERFARALLPGARAAAAEPFTIEGERVFAVESTRAVEPGEAIDARVQGLGGRLEANPLAERQGAIVAFAAVLVIVALGAHAASRAAGARARVEGA